MKFEKFSNVKKRKQIKMSRSAVALLFLCWLVYTCSYIGKLGYSANIVSIESDFEVTHAAAGMASTFFFFSYGTGQIVNGIFCNRYRLKPLIFCILLISAMCNLVVGTINNFAVVKYLWLINGAVLSVLWPSLIRLLSETLKSEYFPKTVVVMGTTVAIGTFAVYGLSALFVSIGNYRVIFYVASVLLPTFALAWIFLYDKLTNNCLGEKEKETQSAERLLENRGQNNKRKTGKTLLFSIISLGFFAIITNLVKDGLTSWVPVILKEQYGVSDSIGIILTLVMPVLALFGTSVAVLCNKKVHDFVDLCGIAFFLLTILTFCLRIAGEKNRGMVITLCCLAGVSLLTSAINNVITSMAPMYLKEQFNSGMLAGVMNGLCYVGSTLSAYGLGAFADSRGWNDVFLFLASLSAVCVAVSLTYFIVNKKRQ